MPLTLTPRGPRPADAAPDPLCAWLAGVSDLPAFDPATPPADGPHRSPAEVHASARAAACPDLFVVHAPDPAAGERVIADLARTSAGRTLVLSPDPAAADRLVECLARVGEAAVVRALADDENPTRPSPVVSRATSVARAEQVRRQAADAVAAADARLTALESLAELTASAAKIDAELAALNAERDAVEAAVRAEASARVAPFDAVADRLNAAREAAAAGILARQRALEDSRHQKEAALADLRRQHADATAEAAKKPGFFARLLGGGKHAADPAELEKQIGDLERESGELATRVAALGADLEALSAASVGEFEKVIAAEVGARRAVFDPRHAALTAERTRIQGRIDALAPVIGPNPPSAGELPAAQRAAARELVAAKERAAAPHDPDAARRRLAESRVVVGTPGSLHADLVFAREPHEPFVLLVLDRAEELSEHDFAHLARLATRWVLVGDVAPADEPRPYMNGRHPHGPGRNGRHPHGPADAPFAARLSRLLDRETWAGEGDRLVCRLTPLTPDERRGMVREPLLDRPEVELRFVEDADGAPVLAEVAFPASASVAEAKSFLFAQLDRVLLRPCGPVEWGHAPGAVVARWPVADHGDSDATWIDLEPGVREKVVGCGAAAFTAAVSFDPTAGWDSEKAADWVARHQPGASAGRFAVVPPCAHA